MIHFCDFAPELLESGFFSGDKFESLSKTLGDANAWIDANRIDVINIETVVLPNMWNREEERTKDVSLSEGGGHASSQWYQFIRVWYRTN